MAAGGFIHVMVDTCRSQMIFTSMQVGLLITLPPSTLPQVVSGKPGQSGQHMA